MSSYGYGSECYFDAGGGYIDWIGSFGLFRMILSVHDTISTTPQCKQSSLGCAATTEILSINILDLRGYGVLDAIMRNDGKSWDVVSRKDE
ncbi:predicted protein [Lichtheimia corymbifera JMRC:FSU:9682]|uniref:Uncharacterized protein n=1 Tax=Lichtheimia corymbifera JMRC:FSU:9682 TaxID=1263082 RepID=A0A068RHN5_9FUNG|nr:predicted protein [Lichtheimia corymbifera JMRC:FSU:9682]